MKCYIQEDERGRTLKSFAKPRITLDLKIITSSNRNKRRLNLVGEIKQFGNGRKQKSHLAERDRCSYSPGSGAISPFNVNPRRRSACRTF